MRLIPLCAFALALSLCTQASLAEVKVVKANGGALPEGAAAITYNPKTGGYNVELLTLYAPGLESVFEIRANANETIDSVISYINGPAAGSPVIIRVYGEAPGYMNSVHSIIQMGTAETILNKVDVTVDVGSVLIEAIGDIVAGRDIIGPIIATTTNNPLRGMTTVHAERDILGDLSAENGRIMLAWAERNIGAPDDPVTIRAKHNVWQVMGDEVFADINTRVNGGTGGFWALVADRFVGSLETEKLFFNPYNSVEGLILIHDEFDGQISIGKSYNNPAQYIQVPTFGLQGQIIINADGIAGGAWNAPVRIGPNGDPNQVLLNGPRYPYSSAFLGGGSVGLVPFRLHDESCIPANGQSIQVSPSGPPLTVQLRHFGPVSWTGALPVTIDRRPLGTFGAFVPVPSSQFSAASSLDSTNVLLVGPSGGGSGFTPGYQYRIRSTSALRSAVPSLPGVQWDFDYIISVVPGAAACAGDVNGDQAVDVDDLLAVINHWGGPPPAQQPAIDTNSDGVIDVDDLLAIINNWGFCN